MVCERGICSVKTALFPLTPLQSSKSLQYMHIYLQPQHYSIISLHPWLIHNSFKQQTQRLVDWNCLVEVTACQHLYVLIQYYNRSSVFSTQVVNVCGQRCGGSRYEAVGAPRRTVRFHCRDETCSETKAPCSISSTGICFHTATPDFEKKIRLAQGES